MNAINAIESLFDAYIALKRQGWKDIEHCPKDGSIFQVIELGSTGIHDCQYQGEWPDGHWWILEGGDLWPSHPLLFRLKD